jgi:ectoine hydroxylase-related dioxygenase (phytanoyl-CoA dioxygenase family)
MKDTPSSVKLEAYKLNNLFLYDNSIRSVALSKRLKPIMEELLGKEPMICNSLNFERGSQQDAHIDSWYMPPPDDENMVAASISLDTVDERNGPIFFYPGSHKIPPYRFSDGRLNVVPEEFHLCLDYIEEQIKQRDLPLVRYQGDPGDVFIWHGQLIHGGSPIKDFSRTRNSLVVHYWRASDVAQQSVARDVGNRAYLAHTLRGELDPVRVPYALTPQ